MPPGPTPIARAFWRLGRQALAPEHLPDRPTNEPPPPEVIRQAVADLRVRRALATYAEETAAGTDPVTAQMATVRALTSVGADAVARAFTTGLAQDADGEKVRRLGLGVILFGLRRFAYAWAQLRDLEPSFVARHAPVEAVHCALVTSDEQAAEHLTAILADLSVLPTADLGQLAGRLLVSGRDDDARRLLDEARSRPDLDEDGARYLETLPRWLDPADPVQVLEGRTVIGVLDYYQPDLTRASHNLGDYVQTLAMLGNLARFQGVRFHGAGGLGEVVSQLQRRVRPELRHPDSPEAEVELIEVSRDFSEGDTLPANTWTIVFGWQLHSLFDLRFGLPYHPNLNPIFLSFHLQYPDALTPEAVDYLKAHGPVGCRDWYTVDILLSAGVPAFFSGCLTTTVNNVFPPRTDAGRDDRIVAIVDLPRNSAPNARRPVERFTHGESTNQALDLVGCVRGADRLLEEYRSRFHRVITSRLHSYLPATSLGIPVSFRPRNASDIRFEGLAHVTEDGAGLQGFKPDDPEFHEIQASLRDLLAGAFELMLSGRSADQVYAQWSELVAPRVAAARERFEAPAPAFTRGFDPLVQVKHVLAHQHHYGPTYLEGATDVALGLDANLKHVLPVNIESIVTHASTPLRLWITSRGLDEEYRQGLAGLFPDVAINFFDFDKVEYGDITRMIDHITIASMDRLLLPDLLPDLDRLVYIDMDTVTLGDVAELAAFDLRGNPIAARDQWNIGPILWKNAGTHIDPKPASDLRRCMAARHRAPYLSFNAGIMVLDLAQMRRDNFLEEIVPMAAEYGLHDQDTLVAYTGPRRTPLPAEWNLMPANDPIEGAKIVHYAGAGKPWADRMVTSADIWRQYADRVAARQP